jgi:hypothetical protein
VARTTTVVYSDRGFWALSDAFGVWLAYLVEELERQNAQTDRSQPLPPAGMPLLLSPTSGRTSGPKPQLSS